VPALDLDRIQAICFDIDGTLANTDDAYIQRAARWLTPLRLLKCGMNPEHTARRLVMAIETPANTFVALLDRLHLDQLLGPVVNGLYRLRGASPSWQIELIPGAAESARRLAQRYPLAICTARESASTRAFLRAHGMESLFACVATARSARRAKPHPAPLLWVARQLGLPPDGLLMVGDTAVDILTGRRAGAQTIGLLCGFGEREELVAAGADLVLDNPVQLVSLLLS
jgi:phosphoglycolate phosphatase-like HAD superfamily hydrolase